MLRLSCPVLALAAGSGAGVFAGSPAPPVPVANRGVRAGLRSQSVMSKPGRGGSRALPWVFTITRLARLADALAPNAVMTLLDRFPATRPLR